MDMRMLICLLIAAFLSSVTIACWAWMNQIPALVVFLVSVAVALCLSHYLE